MYLAYTGSAGTAPKKRIKKSIGRSAGALRVRSVYAWVRTVERVLKKCYFIFSVLLPGYTRKELEM